jgi:hypothetical protein
MVSCGRGRESCAESLTFNYRNAAVPRKISNSVGVYRVQYPNEHVPLRHASSLSHGTVQYPSTQLALAGHCIEALLQSGPGRQSGWQVPWSHINCGPQSAWPLQLSQQRPLMHRPAGHSESTEQAVFVGAVSRQSPDWHVWPLGQSPAPPHW